MTTLKRNQYNFLETFSYKKYKIWLRKIIKQTLKGNFEKISNIVEKNQKIHTEMVKNLGAKSYSGGQIFTVFWLCLN